MSRALEGVRVLDLADRSAALAGRILADLGADVVLVEPPGGVSTRGLAPFLDDVSGPERSFAHLYFNAGKRSVVLDVADAADRARLEQLARTADVVIDTEPPGRLEELGLGHAVLRSAAPRLIQCSVTPFGLHTPWRHRRANDLVAGAAGGLVWLSGEPRGTPVQGGAHPSYTMAGLCAASAVCIALHQRDAEGGTGHGVHIDLSLQEATAMAVMQTATPSQWAWRRHLPRRPGLSSALRCADGGHVGLLVRPDRFDRFLAWADRVGIEHGMTVDDWRWSRLDAPLKGNPVVATTRALAEALTRDEFAAGALEADIVCLPVLGFADLADHEQFVVNDQFLTVHHDGLGTDLGFVRSPVDAMADGVELRRAPQLGEHQWILDELPPALPPPASVARSPLTAPPVADPPVADPPVADPGRALHGVRVVDLGWVLAAPIGTRLLASFGAEVIRVESASKPDSMRSQTGPDGTPHSDLGGLFNAVNAGKQSLAVDLSTPAGLELLHELVATADVVVNNFRPGAMDRMGLGHDVLRRLRPDIISLNLPGAHRRGPWAVRASMGNILMAASGFNMLTGFPDEKPRGIGIAYPDFTSPHLLVATIVAALRHRRRTGEGQELHLTQLSGMLSLLGAEWMEFCATGRQPPRRANRDPNASPHGVYRCRPSQHSDDEWVALAVAGDTEWRALCTALGLPALIADDRFASHDARRANEDALDELLSARLAGCDKWAVADALQAAGVAAAAVEHLADMLERDPQLPDHYQLVQQPVAPHVDIPIDREAARWVGAELILRRSPGLGEHNEHVVRELLGHSEEHYLQLVVDGVLG